LDHYPPPQSIAELNANKFIYELFQKRVTFPTYPMIQLAHNRDVAKTHVAALTAPRLPSREKKRLIVVSQKMTWLDAVKLLSEQRPALASRLPDPKNAHGALESRFELDTQLTQSVLGIRESDCISWETTLLEVVDWLMEWEKDKTEEILNANAGFSGQEE
jgi:nucleoside-diphosphate-sugar epimerase